MKPFFLDQTYLLVSIVQLLVASVLGYQILTKKNDPQVCLGWLLGVALFPLTTLVLYLGVGLDPWYKDIARKRKLLEENQDYLSQKSGLPEKRSVGGFNASFVNIESWLFRRGLESLELSETPEILVNSNVVFDTFKKVILEAKKSIFIQFYQIQADEVGIEFLELLTRKAEQGVLVCVLYDSLGSFSLKSSILDAYRKRGLRIYSFLNIHPIKRRFQLNFRNHRKLIVIDQKISFCGGFNIGLLYEQGPDKSKPKWVDMTVKLNSQAVADSFLQVFKKDWNNASDFKLEYSPIFEPQQCKFSAVKESIYIIPSGPGKTAENFYSLLLQVLYEARVKIEIVTPYLVPDKNLLRALRTCVDRGVLVRILVPRASNHPLTDLCSASFFEELMNIGVEVFLYPHGVVHAKALIADDHFVMAGSSNLDCRSFFLNFETDFFAVSSNLAKELGNFIEHYIEKSDRLTKKDIATKPMYRHILRRILRLFAPLM
jgi:cardiolipin synthase